VTQKTTEGAVAGLVAAMVQPYDTGDVLADLVQDCAALYPAAAVAVMVIDGDRGLEMLSATSHRAEELELLQIQHERGPCVDAARYATVVTATGEEMATRWGPIGDAIAAAGFAGVHAYPMRWRGHALGGLNVFVDSPREPNSEESLIGQLFADLASLVISHSSDIPGEVLSARIHEAMTRARSSSRPRVSSPIARTSTWPTPTTCCATGHGSTDTA